MYASVALGEGRVRCLVLVIQLWRHVEPLIGVLSLRSLESRFRLVLRWFVGRWVKVDHGDRWAVLGFLRNIGGLQDVYKVRWCEKMRDVW